LQKYTAAKVILIAMSLWFYAYFEITYLWIIIASIIFNYLVSKQLQPNKHAIKLSKTLLTLGIFINVGLIFYFKYFNFFFEIINGVFGTSITFEKVLLPLGISFFTFQQIAFVVDTYKGSIKKQNIIDYSLFVTFFPQLIAGPIVSHEEMLPQFEDQSNKKINADNLYQGARLFIIGLAKKVLLADVIGKAVDWGYQYYTVLDGFNTFLVIILYSVQLYLDFSGYCDMARGLGYCFNIQIPVNFVSPFKSKNMVEFWKRWHVTLGRFFTRYVYIPLGGNRKGEMRMLLNVFIVFMLSGIWHGAGWTFVLWGSMHAILQVITRLWWMVKKKWAIPEISNKWLKKAVDCICIIACFLFVAIAFGIFRATNLDQAVYMLKNMVKIDGVKVFLEISSVFQLTEIGYALRFLNMDGLLANPLWQMLGYLLISVWVIWGSKNLYETEEQVRPRAISVFVWAFLFVFAVLNIGQVSSFLYFNF
jgi:D-alanyl-lipoteichoic acid acyltransferase DltB (MBOAT superfamily)